MISLNLPFKAPSVNQLYATVKGRRVKSKKGREFAQLAGLLFNKQYKSDPLIGKLEVELILNFKSNVRTDIDNYNKAIFDSMSGIVFKDDSQIVKLYIEKHMKQEKDSIEIKVKEI